MGTDFIKGPIAKRASNLARIKKLILLFEDAENEPWQGINTDVPNSAEESGTSNPISPLPLFDYQREAIISLAQWYWNESKSCTLLSIPTGAGKTRTAVGFIRLISCIDKLNVVWLAPTRELVSQALSSFSRIQHEYGDFRFTVRENKLIKPTKSESQICFLTFQKAIQSIPVLRSLIESDDSIVVIDEAHVALAEEYSKVVKLSKQAPSCRLLGLTATPGRALSDESKRLSFLFDHNLIVPPLLKEKPIEHLISSGVLSKVTISKIPSSSESNYISVSGANSRKVTNKSLALDTDRFWSIVNFLSGLESGRQALVFTESIEHAYAIGACIYDSIPAAVISSKTDSSRRSFLLRQFETGKLPVLLNARLLTTGFDYPALTDVVLTTPIKSPILWEQIVGRVIRGPLTGGSLEGSYIWEMDDHLSMHQKIMASERYRYLYRKGNW